MKSIMAGQRGMPVPHQAAQARTSRCGVASSSTVARLDGTLSPLLCAMGNKFAQRLALRLAEATAVVGIVGTEVLPRLRLDCATL